MFLLLTIAITCLLLTFAPDIVKLLQLSKLLTLGGGAISEDLQEDLERARNELEAVRRMAPGGGEYAQFIRTMRAEQNVKNLEQRALDERNLNRLKGASVELVVGYGLKGLLSLVLLILSIRNRFVPVLVFADQFNFQPLAGLLSFPTGIHNAISVPVWLLSCNITFRMVSGLIKRRN